MTVNVKDNSLYVNEEIMKCWNLQKEYVISGGNRVLYTLFLYSGFTLNKF